MVRSLPLLLFDSLLVTHSHTLALVLLTWQTVWPWLPQMNKRLSLVLYSHVRSSVPSPKIPLPSPCQPSHPLKPHKRQHNSSFILKSTVQFYYWIIKKNRRLSFKNKHNTSLGHINKKDLFLEKPMYIVSMKGTGHHRHCHKTEIISFQAKKLKTPDQTGKTQV